MRLRSAPHKFAPLHAAAISKQQAPSMKTRHICAAPYGIVGLFFTSAMKKREKKVLVALPVFNDRFSYRYGTVIFSLSDFALNKKKFILGTYLLYGLLIKTFIFIFLFSYHTYFKNIFKQKKV